MSSEVVKLGKKGQLSLSRGAMDRLGLEGGETMLLDVTDDGAIVLRLAGVYPLEVYSEERIREFAEGDAASDKERDTVARILSDSASESEG